MNPKVKAIKISKVTQLVADSVIELQEQCVRDLQPLARSEGVTGDVLLGSCVYLNHLACERLLDNGINATLLGGRASFGVNKNQYGVIDYGYEENMPTLMPDGTLFQGVGFAGHCWCEVKKLDLIIDITLARLPQFIQSDNLNRGIVDNDFLLDPKKVVISRSELVPRRNIVSGSLGYHYASNREYTDRALSKLAELKSMII